MEFINLLVLWSKAILFFTIIGWVGLVLIRRVTSEKRFEILLPCGLLTGVFIYIFLLNILSFFVKGEIGIIISLVTFFGLGFIASKMLSVEKFDFPKDKTLIYWLITLLGWSILIFWMVGRTNFGGDISLFYSIGKTFSRGNFPILSPWQPDLSVSYHYGGSILLGAAHFVTKLDFEFLHGFFAFLYITSAVQILLWFWKRHNNLLSLILYNLIPLVAFISFGAFFIIKPVFPFTIPEISNIRDFVLWGRELPRIETAYETYGGAPANIGGLTYFLHHGLGLSVLIVLIWISRKASRKYYYLSMLTLAIGLTSLALINEIFFVISIPAVAVLLIHRLILNKQLNTKNLLFMFLAAMIFSIVVIFQGGVITDSSVGKDKLETSIAIFPTAEDFKGGNYTLDSIRGYHIRQLFPRLFKTNSDWLPFQWSFINSAWLIGINIIGAIILLANRNKDKFLLVFTFLILTVASMFLYLNVVPRFAYFNANRLVSMVYQFSGIGISFLIIWLLEWLYGRKKLLFLIGLVVTLYIIIPSLLSPTMSFSLFRYRESRLIPKIFETSKTVKWMKNNMNYNERVLNMTGSFVGKSPRGGSVGDTLVTAGIFTPTFTSKYRAYTLEAGPYYVDAMYTLNPQSLKELGISHIRINNEHFSNLPKRRQENIENPKYFTNIFESKTSSGESWERIYEINKYYYEEADNLSGTFIELNEILPKESNVYVEDWKDEYPWNILRKTVLFVLGDKKIFFHWGPGVYLNVERFLFANRLLEEPVIYDYLILDSNTNPKDICECGVGLFWIGIGDNIKVWKVI